MCGIFGVVVNKKLEIANILIEGLSRLEYRGYDSAGIATIENNKFNVIKSVGQVEHLFKKLKKTNIAEAVCGIAHTRWATHGKPSENNCHPHICQNISLVHNGIIENYLEIKNKLLAKNYKFNSETDSEVIAVLIYDLMLENNECELYQIIFKLTNILKGSYSLAIINSEQEQIIAFKNGSPLVVGKGKDGCFLSSDANALAGMCDLIYYLEDHELAIISQDIKLYNASSEKNLEFKFQEFIQNYDQISKGNYSTFMMKEICEQPQMITNCLEYYKDNNILKSLEKMPQNFQDIYMVACGSSFYAASCLKYLFESRARINVNTEISSEFRYRDIVFKENGVVILISQSGETKDTLAALQYAKDNKQYIIALVNVVESSIARQADLVLPILAGPEIGVASTKAFTNQLLVLTLLLNSLTENKLHLENLSNNIKNLLKISSKIKKLSSMLAINNSILFLARGNLLPIAQEAALKLKELSYIHAEALAAGELKHGPIALIDNKITTIVFVNSGYKDYHKTITAIEEIAARDGKLLVIGDKIATEELKQNISQLEIITMPDFPEQQLIFAYTIISQLIAYHIAEAKGCNIDKPRNLAKSVTVE